MRELKRCMRVESVDYYMDRDQRIDRVRLKDRAQRTIQSLEEIEESCSEALRSAYRVKDLADLDVNPNNLKSIKWHISNIEGCFRRILEDSRRNFNLYCKSKYIDLQYKLKFEAYSNST